MAKIKSATLTPDTDKTYTVTGGHLICIHNHGIAGTANPAVAFANINAAATDAGDNMIPCGPGRRIINVGDHDGSVDIHVICAAANRISVEVISDGEEEYLL